MVSSIRWYQLARRAVSHLHQQLGQRAKSLAQHIAILFVEKLVNKHV
jgi:hypothetical protein